MKIKRLKEILNNYGDSCDVRIVTNSDCDIFDYSEEGNSKDLESTTFVFSKNTLYLASE